MLVNDDDRRFIADYFPGLKFTNQRNGVLKGQLSFVCSFNKKNRKYNIYDKLLNNTSRNLISDGYEIEIDLTPGKNVFREVKEIGGKIRKVAELKELNLRDLHYYELTDKVCLVGYFEEKQDISLTVFLGKYVIPFFYDQSYFAKYGKWPRGYYSHGCLGILENYYEVVQKNKSDQEQHTIKCIDFLNSLYDANQDQGGYSNIKNLMGKKRIKSHWNCITCGFKRLKRVGLRPHRRPQLSKFHFCHPVGLQGIRVLHKNVKRYNLKNNFKY